MNQFDDDFDSLRLEQLIADRCNDALTPDGEQELAAIFARSANARAAYWEHIAVHAGLSWAHRGKAECDIRLAEMDPEVLPVAETRRVSDGRIFLIGEWKYLLALAIAASLLIVFWKGAWQTPPSDTGSDMIAAESRQPGVLGTILKLSPDSHWSFGTSGERDQRAFQTGNTLWLNKGAVALRLTNGVEAQLEAPLILQMESLRSARVLRGKMTVDVPKGQEGFTVETMAARVIDLGTTFSVDVADSGTTDVVVFNGEVDVDLASLQAEHISNSAESSQRRLHRGEALRVSEDGTLSRIVNVRRTDFSGRRSNTSLIKEVRDNIVRGQTIKYYEIIAGGLQEDTQAFVDRNYQWNGVDERGIPAYLIGGDYVKTFNDDKVTPNLSIAVALEKPANLYLLVDDRLEQTDWLLEQFEDTGDNIGVDEGHRLENDGRMLARGPGNSIDQIHSIWRFRDLGSRIVRIGAFGPVGSKKQRKGVKAKLSMYGIVAVPLQDNR